MAVANPVCFENALLKGYAALEKYYSPVIINLAFQYSNSSRATLNCKDLEQVIRIALWRCFEKQKKTNAIKDFDNFFKTSAINDMRTALSTEFCQKRCPETITFFSEIEAQTEREFDIDSMLEHDGSEEEYTSLSEDVCNCLPIDCRPVVGSLLLQLMEAETGTVVNLYRSSVRQKIAEDLSLNIESVGIYISRVQEILLMHRKDLFCTR